MTNNNNPNSASKCLVFNIVTCRFTSIPIEHFVIYSNFVYSKNHVYLSVQGLFEARGNRWRQSTCLVFEVHTLYSCLTNIYIVHTVYLTFLLQYTGVQFKVVFCLCVMKTQNFNIDVIYHNRKMSIIRKSYKGFNVLIVKHNVFTTIPANIHGGVK